MGIGKFLAQQLRQPWGWFGGQIISRVLNRDNASMNELALEMLNPSQGDCILEVGFGGGYLLNKILADSGVKLVAGVDISPEMVAFCQRRFQSEIATGKLQLHCGNLEDLPYRLAYFTKICTVNTIYFWSDVKQTLARMHGVLRQGGLLVICFNSQGFLKQTILPKYGFQAYEVERVKDWMKLVGFQNIYWLEKSDTKQDFICIVGEKI
ncbi:MAG: class I SAM-dependent methyltransferase [Nostocaceae cyanobacterium]|nr:class I SAM-dependent methyltransferase [Nostocaceae cyanobacterium]